MEALRRSTRLPMTSSALAILVITATGLLWRRKQQLTPPRLTSRSASRHRLKVVKQGETVTIEVSVENRGTVASFGVGVGMAGLGGADKVTNNPYQSFSASQGACTGEC